MFKVITPVGTELVTAAEAKNHLKVDTSADDALIAALIVAAREWAEHYTGRALAPQTLELALPCFPECHIDLPRPPVASITSIKYTDMSGAEQTVSSSDYTLSLYGDACRVNPAYLFIWPSTQDVADAVRVRYVTGYTTAPKAARQALLLAIGHLYENRSAVGDAKLVEMPFAARALLEPIKIWSR